MNNSEIEQLLRDAAALANVASRPPANKLLLGLLSRTVQLCEQVLNQADGRPREEDIAL